MLCVQELCEFIDQNHYCYDAHVLKTLKKRIVAWHTLRGRIDEKCVCCRKPRVLPSEFLILKFKKLCQHTKSRFSKAVSSNRSRDTSPLPFPVAPKEIIEAAISQHVDPVYYLLKQAMSIRAGSHTAALLPPSPAVPHIVADNLDCSHNGPISSSAYSSASQLVPSSYVSSQDHLYLPTTALSSVKSSSVDSQTSDYSSDDQQRRLFARSEKFHTAEVNGTESVNLIMSKNSYEDMEKPCSDWQCCYEKSSKPLPSLGHCLVIREYNAKGPEELSVKLGERVYVLESSDDQWWQASKPDARVGLVPAASLARVSSQEHLYCVNQTMQLFVGNESVWLFKDQIVFGHEDAGKPQYIHIRTMDHRRGNCPLKYLTIID